MAAVDPRDVVVCSRSEGTMVIDIFDAKSRTLVWH